MRLRQGAVMRMNHWTETFYTFFSGLIYQRPWNESVTGIRWLQLLGHTSLLAYYLTTVSS